jgi:hypothetical protein
MKTFNQYPGPEKKPEIEPVIPEKPVVPEPEVLPTPERTPEEPKPEIFPVPGPEIDPGKQTTLNKII